MKKYICVIAIFILSVFFSGCDMLPDSEKTKFEKRQIKQMKPVEVDVSDIRKQGEELQKLFKDTFKPLQYKQEKNPFESVVEIYRSSQKGDSSGNPLKELTLDQISLVGTLQGEVGVIGVLNAGGEIYYVKTGDRIGKDNGVIIDISKNKLSLRQKEQDIFGNVRSTIKELTLDSKEGKL